MFKSKFTIFVLTLLIICLILTVHWALVNPVETGSADEDFDDSAVIRIYDENGSSKLTRVYGVRGESSASAPT